MATSQKGIGVPVKLIHEAEGHVVTIELKSGEMYRGELFDVEDNWNCQVKDVTATAKDGRVSQLDHIYVRGGRIRLIIVPDMLKNAPMFKRIDPKNKGKVSHAIFCERVFMSIHEFQGNSEAIP
jgi:small nuclear ribonucleoprotein D3